MHSSNLVSLVSKKIFILSALSFISVSVFAVQTNKSSTFEIDMDLSLNGGKHVTSPRVIVKSGQSATIAQSSKDEEVFVEVVATEDQIQDDSGIMMKFKVGTIGKDGTKTIISEPQILAKNNEPAQISVGDSTNGTEKVSLIVVAKKTPTKAQAEALKTSKQK